MIIQMTNAPMAMDSETGHAVATRALMVWLVVASSPCTVPGSARSARGERRATPRCRGVSPDEQTLDEFPVLDIHRLVIAEGLAVALEDGGGAVPCTRVAGRITRSGEEQQEGRAGDQEQHDHDRQHAPDDVVTPGPSLKRSGDAHDARPAPCTKLAQLALTEIVAGS